MRTPILFVALVIVTAANNARADGESPPEMPAAEDIPCDAGNTKCVGKPKAAPSAKAKAPPPAKPQTATRDAATTSDPKDDADDDRGDSKAKDDPPKGDSKASADGGTPDTTHLSQEDIDRLAEAIVKKGGGKTTVVIDNKVSADGGRREVRYHPPGTTVSSSATPTPAEHAKVVIAAPAPAKSGSSTAGSSGFSITPNLALSGLGVSPGWALQLTLTTRFWERGIMRVGGGLTLLNDTEHADGRPMTIIPGGFVGHLFPNYMASIGGLLAGDFVEVSAMWSSAVSWNGWMTRSLGVLATVNLFDGWLKVGVHAHIQLPNEAVRGKQGLYPVPAVGAEGFVEVPLPWFK